MSTEPDDPRDDDDDALEHDTGLPVHRSQLLPEDIPDFLQRALDHLRGLSEVEDFSVDGVDFETAAGVWLAPIGVYDPDLDTPSTREQIAAGESPTGVWGNRMVDWSIRAQQAMRASWGEPVVHTPRLVGDAEEPEGILDYLLIAQDFAQAELWDRREVFVALLTEWVGEPAESTLRQIVLVLPRELMMQGMGAFLTDDEAKQELLMHGEDPLELHRRSWLLSAIFDRGEVRVRDARIEATRCSLQSTTGRITTWIFADDGRQLLLMQDPQCDFAEVLDRLSEEESADDLPAGADHVRERWSESQLILIDRLLGGVPDDLRECIAARGETMAGGVAEHSLEFGLLGDRPVPIISGAFWFDGAVWRAAPGLIEVGYQNGLVIDDFGMSEAVRKPFRLGGAFTPAELTPANEPERGPMLQQIFDACPYPEQARPQGDVVLGYGIPTSLDQSGIVDAIERASAAWWDGDPEDATLGDDTFVIGGCRLTAGGGSGALDTVLAQSDYWTVDALKEWNSRLGMAMTERWGEPTTTAYEEGRPGSDHRTPLTDVMRATGLVAGPMWWVNGHAVVLLAGFPDPEYSDSPQVILVMCRADAVIELLGRMNVWETRWRARAVENLADLVSARDHEPLLSPRSARTAARGPALEGSDLVPPARRIAIRVEDFLWVFHLTHDGRGLLVSYRAGTDADEDADVAGDGLFSGVPSDLLSLLLEEEPGEAYPHAAAVFFRRGGYWRASQGMLRRAYAEARSGRTDPLSALYSARAGVQQLRRVLSAPESMSPVELCQPEYARYAFGREVSGDEALTALERVGAPLTAALTGTLNELLDVVVNFQPGLRYLLDAALSTVNPDDRREKSLWLLENGAKPSNQLSFMTPVNLLLANPTLGGGDAVLLRRLLETGADAGTGLLGPDGLDALSQLRSRGLDAAEAAPLVELLSRGPGD